jgi:hypothetical protein
VAASNQNRPHYIKEVTLQTVLDNALREYMDNHKPGDIQEYTPQYAFLSKKSLTPTREYIEKRIAEE